MLLRRHLEPASRLGSSSLAAPLILLALLQAAFTVDATFPPMIIFGDSLSDTGYALNCTRCTVPTRAAYFRGRWSNGPTWPDHLNSIARKSLRVVNYAFGGSTACKVGGVAAGSLSLSDQVSLYLAASRSAVADSGANASGGSSTRCLPLQSVPTAARVNATCLQRGLFGRIFVVFIGHNDLLALNDTQLTDPQVYDDTVDGILACRVAALDRLMGALHRSSCGGGFGDRIIVWNLAPVDTAPLVPEPARQFMRAAVADHNARLEASLAPLRGKYPGGPSLQVYDINSAVTDGVLAAASSGLLNTTAPCIANFQGTSGSPLDRAIEVATSATSADVCASPNSYVLYDGLHPTSIAHKLAFADPFAVKLGWLSLPNGR